MDPPPEAESVLTSVLSVVFISTYLRASGSPNSRSRRIEYTRKKYICLYEESKVRRDNHEQFGPLPALSVIFSEDNFYIHLIENFNI